MGNTGGKEESHRKQKESHTGTTHLSAVLGELRKLQTKPKNILTVERSEIIGSALPYFKMPGCEYSPLEVHMQTEGVKELSTDLGGPTREFFTLLFKEMLRKDVDMFEGQDQGRNLLPVNNDKAITGGLFTILGKALVVSLLSGGPGFPYLAPCVVSYIRDIQYEHELGIGLVYNVVLRQLIKRIEFKPATSGLEFDLSSRNSNEGSSSIGSAVKFNMEKDINYADSADKLQEALDSDTERFIDNCGWPRYQMITMENRLQLTQTLLMWELIGKRASALDQLKKGLNALSFLDRTANIPEANNALMHSNAEKATAEYLKTRLKAELEKLRAMNETEENAKKFTMSCLEMMTDIEATHLFHFITGMSSLSVEEIPVEVEFNRSNKSAVLPEAITCIQRLKIPLGNDSPIALYSSFHKVLSVGRYGFGGKDV